MLKGSKLLIITGAYTYMFARYSLYSYIFSWCIPILQFCSTSIRADVLQCPCQSRKKILPVQLMYVQMFPCMLHSSCVLLITFAVEKNVVICSLCYSNEDSLDSRVCMTKNSSVRLSFLLVIFGFLFFLNMEDETLFLVYICFLER